MRKLYMTIDDGPSPDMTVKVDYLLEKGIPAIWFCTGKRMELNPVPVIDAVKKGFIIGNHSYSHPYFSQIGLDNAKNEIAKTEEIIDNLYLKAEVIRTEKLFRFPFGDKGVGLSPVKNFFRKLSPTFKSLQQLLKLHGITAFSQANFNPPFPASLKFTDVDVYWTFCAREWSVFDSKASGGSTKEEILERLELLQTGNKDEMFLIHDSKKSTELFFEIIEVVKNMNFLFDLPGDCQKIKINPLVD